MSFIKILNIILYTCKESSLYNHTAVTHSMTAISHIYIILISEAEYTMNLLFT